MVYCALPTPPAARAGLAPLVFVIKPRRSISRLRGREETLARCESSYVRKNDMASRRGTDEIVEEIVDHLRPWKGHKSVAAITAAVNHELGVLLKLAPLAAKLSDRARNRAHAKKLDGALSEVETLLASAPGVLAWLLFDPLPPMTIAKDGQLLQDTQSIEDIKLAYRARADSFCAELKQLRKVCARAIDPGFGSHPNYDQAKHLCAWHALGLMRELSDGKITGTKDSAFRVITGLLYEALSGQQDADLKRACDSVLLNLNPRSGTD
jgi:hypothetical protein